jgi:PTS system nitrogen regulatory IIA component
MRDLVHIVHLDLEANGVEATLRSQVQALHEAGHITEVEEPLRLLMEREEVHSTAMGGGVAFPHARWGECTKLVVAVARMRQEIDFGASGGGPVDMVFLLLGPEDDPGGHVKMLGKLARLVGRKDAMTGLRAASDEAGFRNCLESVLF